MLVWAGWVFLALVWGTTWAAIKVGLETLPPVSFAGVRFLIAAVVMWPFLRAAKRPLPDRRGWWLIGVTALITISLQYALQFWGQQYVASGLSGVIGATIPVFTAIFAHFSIQAERLTLTGAAGILLGIGGVAIIFSDQLQSGEALAVYGALALTLAAVATSRAQVSVKQHGRHIDPFVFTCGQFSVGCLPLLVGGFLLDGSPAALNWTPVGVGAVLYLAVAGSAMAFGIMYWLFHHMAITKVMAVGFVNPLVAVLVGWLFLNEQMTLRAGIGGGAVLLGVALVLRTPRPRALGETHG